MSEDLQASSLVRAARERSGLSQRELARLASTTQSVVARIETGLTSPTVATLKRLLAAAGFEIHAELVLHPVIGSHMLDDVQRILSMTPEQRLLEVRNVARFLAAARRV